MGPKDATASDAEPVGKVDVTDALAVTEKCSPGADCPAEPRAPGGTDAVGVEDMIGSEVIAARRRNESLQNVPVAVTALASRALLTRDVRRLSDLDGLVPGLAIDSAHGTANSGRITIRGVGQGDPGISNDPSVGVYVNGAYASRTQGLVGALYDVERVEVLRGPQGALFGKNTIGGAINVITRKPEFDLGGQGEVRVGSFGQLDTRWALNLPLLAERAALRVSLASNYDEGYQKDVQLGERFGDDRLLGGRAQLLLLPTDSVEIMLMAEYAGQKRRPQAAKCELLAAPPVALAAPLQAVLDQARQECAQDDARSDLKSASNLRFAEDDLASTLLTSEINWDLSDMLMLRSITSYRDQDNGLRQDLDGTPRGILDPALHVGGSDQRAYTQELQLSGGAAAGRFSFMLGIFALGESVDDRNVGGTASAFVSELSDIRAVLDEQVESRNRSYAAYGELSYKVTERLTASAGLRRSLERRSLSKQIVVLTQVPGGAAPDTVAFAFDRSERFSDFSPSASLAYQWTPSVLAYASYATGFQSGGFNGRATRFSGPESEIDPEQLTTYEVGVKSTFFRERLLLNAATYYSIYEDIQRPIATVGSNLLPALIVRNAAEARMGGAELEVVALPAPDLRVEAALSAFRSRYTDFDFLGDPSSADARMPNQPNYLLTFAAEYDAALGPLGLLNTRLQWTHRGAQSNDALDSRSIRSDKYGLLDARLVLSLPDGRTEIALFGTNLLDRSYFHNGLDLSQSLGLALRFFAPPRRYGAEVRRSF